MGESVDEVVLVVPTARFHNLGYFQGFCRQPGSYLKELLRAEHLSFRPRSLVEDDPSFKQLIPYVILRWTESDGSDFVFQYTRSSMQDESRLRSKKSVGVGGHISEIDAHLGTNESTYQNGMKREISEEIDVRSPYADSFVGLINDDTNPVGQVHLGIVHMFDVERPLAYARDPNMQDAGFRPVRELIPIESEFETWSQMCIRCLFANG